MLKKILAYAVAVIILMACQESEQFFDSKKTEGFWHKDSIVDFSFKAPDTTDNYNFYIHVRNTKDYNYSNLFLITSMQFPYGKTVVDTLEYEMAFKDGRLMGEGIGSLKYNKLWYKEAIKFSEVGEYKLNIRHAMRKSNTIETLDKLQGVEEIGFSYEPVNPDKS